MTATLLIALTLDTDEALAAEADLRRVVREWADGVTHRVYRDAGVEVQAVQAAVVAGDLGPVVAALAGADHE